MGAARQAGFTLIELLAVVAIVALLVAFLLPTLGRAKSIARKVRELSGARQLMTATVMYANDSRDQVPVGYANAAMVASNGPVAVYNAEGERISGLAAQRYPWRLASYMGDDLRGFYHDPKVLGELRAGASKYAAWGIDYTYFVSLYPSMGINARFFGGDAQSTLDPLFQRTYGKAYLSRLGDASRPSSLIAFTSARSAGFAGTEEFASVEGCYRVDPPYFAQPRPRLWESAYDARAASPGLNSGFVALRYEGKAVVALVDGHADAWDWSTLQNMQLWCEQATLPGWSLSAK